MSKNDCRQQQVTLERTADPAGAIQNMHDIFADPYRCAILHYLQQADGEVALRDVAKTIDEWSPNGDEAEREYGDRIESWLRDEHLLQMGEFGVLVCDFQNDIVWLPQDVSFSVTNPWTSA